LINGLGHESSGFGRIPLRNHSNDGEKENSPSRVVGNCFHVWLDIWFVVEVE
jgi:hypothetical protein